MKCIVPGANCKIFGRAIHALAKIGDEMYVEPREKSLLLKCVSASYSAYCEFTFHNNFFAFYNFGDLEEEDALKCKISMRSALTVFKSPAMIDKLVESCHIKLEPGDDKLTVVFNFKNSVIKTFFLSILDCENLTVPYTKNNIPNKLSASSKVFIDAVQNFQQSLIEITIEVTPQKLVMRNYVDDTSTIGNLTRTQLALTIGEFDEYKIGIEARITFCMKELRALLTFAESVREAVNIYFESTGKPVLFDLNNPAFAANLVLSTLNPDGDDSSVSTVQEVRSAVRKKPAAKKRQPAKSSKSKAPPKKSTMPNRSMNASSNLSARYNETNTPSNHTQMELDQNSDQHGFNGVRCDRVSMSALENNSSPRIGSRESLRKRSNILKTPSSYSATTSNYSSPVVSTLNPKSRTETEPSIFSSGWKQRSGSIDEIQQDVPMDEDGEVPGSPPPPPSKKAKIIFKKCFETTFDPRMLPGHDGLLADDSDEGN